MSAQARKLLLVRRESGDWIFMFEKIGGNGREGTLARHLTEREGQMLCDAIAELVAAAVAHRPITTVRESLRESSQFTY